MVDTFRRKKVQEGLISLIPNGCDNEWVQPSKSRPFNLTGILAGDFVAVYSGAHGVANGLDKLIDAAVNLRARGCEHIKIVLIGDGSQKHALMSRVNAEGLQSLVLFFDPIPKDRLLPLMTRADLGLMILDNIPVFRYGSSPNKFFDYLSCGIPVLVNSPGWVRDLIAEAKCGVFADPSDRQSLAERLFELSKLEIRDRLEMGKRARLLAETQFDRRLLSRRFIDALESADRRWKGADATNVAGHAQ